MKFNGKEENLEIQLEKGDFVQLNQKADESLAGTIIRISNIKKISIKNKQGIAEDVMAIDGYVVLPKNNPDDKMKIININNVMIDQIAPIHPNFGPQEKEIGQEAVIKFVPLEQGILGEVIMIVLNVKENGRLEGIVVLPKATKSLILTNVNPKEVEFLGYAPFIPDIENYIKEKRIEGEIIE